ncbi:MAG: TlpA family protein disulfide reductase [Saprospiraceae bacterium]|nr:TlpA family protein disulfide reductase [Saprospiraceae bacterium]
MKFNLNTFLNILIIILILGFVVRKLYLKPKQKAGEVSVDFTTTLKDGSPFTLSDLKGQYVLLSFWASWCGPCRKKNEEMVRLFDQFKYSVFTDGTSFKIVSVGLENSKEKWEKAIQKDRLFWYYHIYQENTFSGPVAQLYKVKEIPATYFINPEGKIIMVNPDIEEIHDYLSNKVK